MKTIYAMKDLLYDYDPTLDEKDQVRIMIRKMRSNTIDKVNPL